MFLLSIRQTHVLVSTPYLTVKSKIRQEGLLVMISIFLNHVNNRTELLGHMVQVQIYLCTRSKEIK
jgi:hypothetical protein